MAVIEGFVAGTGKVQAIQVDTNGVVQTSGSGAANATVDLNKVAGTATSVNTGAADAGSQRVVIANNGPINVAQINGVTTSVNAGAPDTGSQRVALALPANATVTGSPPPSLSIGVWNATSGALAAVRQGDLGSVLVTNSGPYPANSANSVVAVPITASSGNVANASAAATLAASATKTTYISGFQVTAGGATAGAVVTVTVAGLIGGTNSFTFAAPVGALVEATPLIVTFPYPIPGSAVNTAIVVTCPALGAGNTNSTVSAQGFQL